MSRRSSAFAYVDDRSVGLRSRFQDDLNAQETQTMQAVRQNFIYRPSTKVWSMALDPIDNRYLLVGTATSNLLLYDLQILDRATNINRSSCIRSSTTDSSTSYPYDTSNLCPPVAFVGAKMVRNGNDDTPLNPRRPLQYGISAIDWYPVDGGIFVTSSFDQQVHVWDSDMLRIVSTFALDAKVFAAKFSPIATSHALIAAVTAKGELRLCDMAIEASIHSLLGHKDEIWSLAWSCENEYQLATGSRDGELRLWDIRRSGSTACLLCLNHDGPAVVPGRSSLYTNVKKLPTMSLAAAARASRKRRRGQEASDNDEERGRSNRHRHDQSTRNGNAIFRSDERSTVVNHSPPAPRTVKRNDPHAAASVSYVSAHQGGINSLTYTPDGRFLLSSGTDQTLRLWNSKTGDHLFMNYEGITNQLTARCVQMAVVQEADAWTSTLVFHPNGHQGQLNAYRVFGESGTPLLRSTAHYQQITSCVYRKTHRELFTGGEDGLIMKWRPSPIILCPDIGEDDDEMHDNTLRVEAGRDASVHIEGAAEGDVDAWSDEDEDNNDGANNQRFIPPILREDPY